jgi:hypothetical protein
LFLCAPAAGLNSARQRRQLAFRRGTAALRCRAEAKPYPNR